MSQNQHLQNHEGIRAQSWLVMVSDTDLLNMIRSMQVILRFDIFELRELFETTDWLIAAGSDSLPTSIPDVAVIELCPEAPAMANQEFLLKVRTISQLARLPVILLCPAELSVSQKTEMLEHYGVNAVVAKPLPGLFELNRLISEVCETV
jgi:hypothetical protein